MSITEAILKVKPKIQARKLAERKKKRLEAQKQKQQDEEEYQESKRMLSLLRKKWLPLKKAIKDKELMKGIKFLESQDKHFRLVGGNRWAVYLGSDGRFRMQRWGMYMGTSFIKPLTLDNIYFIDEKDIEKVVKMDLKKEVEKQVLGNAPNAAQWHSFYVVYLFKSRSKLKEYQEKFATKLESNHNNKYGKTVFTKRFFYEEITP